MFLQCIILFIDAILPSTIIEGVYTMRKHNERFVQIGLNISFYRKIKGLTQMELAEKIGISRTHMSNIEAPNMETAPSLETLLEIADQLGVEPSKLLEFRHNS